MVNLGFFAITWVPFLIAVTSMEGIGGIFGAIEELTAFIISAVGGSIFDRIIENFSYEVNRLKKIVSVFPN